MKTNLIQNGILLLFCCFFLFTCLLISLTAIAQMDEPDIAIWLTEHPFISKTIQWEDSNGIKAYPDWSATQKADLIRMYQKVRNNESLGLTDPPPNIANPTGDEYPVTVLSKDDAWPIFLAYVAYSLAVETSEWVSWSLTEYSQEELLELFDGSKMYSYDIHLGGYELRHTATPTPPDFTFEFMNTNNIVAEDRLQTIANILEWCRSNLAHFTGEFNAKNFEGHWQYRGYPPISRVITGTVKVVPVRSSPQNYVNSGYHTAGCWGTTAFLRAVLRVVNIPVKEVLAGGHSLPYFISEDKYLSHGDDPYNQNSRNWNHPHPFPIEELFIDQSTYEAWFVLGDAHQNIGRKVSELMIEYLPLATLNAHCQDILDGKSHAESYVYNQWSALNFIYSVEELEAMSFWDRMDAKIESLGGCAIVAPSLKSVKVSEIMVASNGGSLPQWIELHNYSDTQVDLTAWNLFIENYNSRDYIGELNLVLSLNGYSIKPGGTLLIVSKQGRSSENFKKDQIYNLDTTHSNLQDIVLNEKGFSIRLINPKRVISDKIGNFDFVKNKLTWTLPIDMTKEGERSSLMRRYSAETLMPLDGTDANNWIQSSEIKLSVIRYWGNATDIGNPGHRGGGALPVQLSFFQAKLTDTGVVVKWITESEVDNAGFYIYRSKTKDGVFKVINPTLIQGAGTTGERNEYTWKDTAAKPNTVYYYRIEDVSQTGIRKQLATIRLRGLMSASGKLTTRWADLKKQN